MKWTTGKCWAALEILCSAHADDLLTKLSILSICPNFRFELQLFSPNKSFSENGLVAYKDGQLIGKQAFHKFLGEENVKSLVNFVLHYIADLDIPIKRGTFIEFRAGMINVSPIGRNCSQSERDDYEKFDLEHGIRKKFVEVLKEKFAHLNLTYSIGGQISFDVFPQGWDKTYCLNFIGEGEYDEIHFFGDKTFQGGNDYEIFTHPRVIGHTVTSPEDTLQQCKDLFGL